MILITEFWSGLSGSIGNAILLASLLTVSLLLLDFVKRRKNLPRYPPGPPSRPFLGNVLQIDFNNLHTSFSQLSEKYGDIFSVQYFWKNMVVLNGFNVIKEALLFKSEDIADRPKFPLYEFLGYTGNSKGLVLAEYGDSWKEQRRFAFTMLRNFGMGKKSIEEKIVEEAGHLCSAFESEKGPFNPHHLVHNAVSNVICSITISDRFEYDDDKFQEMLKLFDDALNAKSGPVAMLLNEVPWLLKIPGLGKKVLQPQFKVYKFIKEIIEEHKKTRDPDHCRDYIDSFLQEMDKKKVHEEIDLVIGRDRKPAMEDQLNMPYTNAVIHEIQRCGDIVPLAIPHMTYRDTEIQGFCIPKGTMVTLNLSSVLKDKTHWERPLQFYPEHFLNAEGKFIKREGFMPFSAGRRVCPGELLARMELFIFFTSLMQRFNFEIPSDQPRPRLDGVFTMTLSPHPFKMCAKVR